MARPVLFLIQIEIEGPGRIADCLRQRGLTWEEVHLYRGDPLPDSLDPYSAVVPLGGPMNVYEEERYPFLRDEDRLLRRALTQETPILGLCLGAQLLAKAADAMVEKNPTAEIGWMDVDLLQPGQADPLFRGLPRRLPVFQWHGDTFELPQGAEWLASSERCAHQAFRVGRRAYGLQFHLEVTPAMVLQWTEAYLEDLHRHDDARSIERSLREDGERYDPALAQAAERLVENFLDRVVSDESD